MTPSLPPLGADPSRRAFLVAAPVAALGVALAGCSSDSSTTGSTAAPGTSGITAPTGSTVDSVGNQWPMYGHDHAQTRTNVAETTITSDTVARLATTWEIPELVGVTGTPTVVDDIAHFCDWKGQVWAVRADTGEKVWTTMIGGMIVGAPRSTATRCTRRPATCCTD